MKNQEKVLIVDDNSDNLKVMTAVLNNGIPNLDIATIQDPLQVMESIESSKDLSVILLDVHMPGMTGVKLCNMIKASEKGRNIPVILMTSHNASSVLKSQALEIGADDFLTRPINNIELVARIKVALRISRAEKALRQKADSAENKLFVTQALLQAAMDNSQVGVAIADAPDGKLTYVNEAGLMIRGDTTKEVIENIGIFEYVQSWQLYDLDGVPLEKDEVPLARAIKYGEKCTKEFIIRRDDNEDRVVLANSAPIVDEEGKVISAIVMFTDITERKELEIELSRLFMAINQAAEMIFITDPEGSIQYVNPAFEKVTGHKAEEVIGKNPSILKSGKQDEYFYKEMWSAISNGQTWKGNMVNKRKDGSLYTEEALISPVFNEKKVIVNYVAVKRDITDELALQSHSKRAEMLNAIGHLAGGIAHDFNNILTGIFGNLIFIKDKIEDSHPAYKHIEESEKSLSRATSLTKQLLTFAKGGNPFKEDVDLENLIKDTVNFDLTGSKVKGVFDISEDIWAAKVDKGQIQQVFSNLAINASQAMPEGGHLNVALENVEIEKNAVVGLDEGKYIKAVVKDTGTGISKELVDKIFDPYFTTKQAGSGIGLATVYSIMDRHGGNISVDSELGVGTTFTLYLPASFDKKIKDKASPEKEKVRKAEEGEIKGRILLMDDEEMIHGFVKEIMKHYGYSMVSAMDGKEAIELYQQSLDEGKPFDAVIMDLTVPGGMGGKDAVRSILEINPEVTCIVSSGYSSDDTMAEHLEYGFKGVIPKPFTADCLVETLDELINQKS